MTDTNLGTRSDRKLQKPRNYAVRFHNDDFTPMEFVIAVLTNIFKLDQDSAVSLTMKIDKSGSALHGPYPLEIAETRATLTMDWAKAYELPFKCTVEPA